MRQRNLDGVGEDEAAIADLESHVEHQEQKGQQQDHVAVAAVAAMWHKRLRRPRRMLTAWHSHHCGRGDRVTGAT